MKLGLKRQLDQTNYIHLILMAVTHAKTMFRSSFIGNLYATYMIKYNTYIHSLGITYRVK